ncbi:hypothetical protein KZX46_02370 (plasmid) [Polymorphobacter sp. PAMC 29334]|uniref:hypothetical protein n=1 Tax=Polymorphobacter sp. PAMC 29334 TaxID=2862331 RepID=UPI001C7525A5|nr:hypothetical protein [Polymorphobacter sp. PAMC 29334]QYE33004.1 hypothetical protein KZX46_02370 [Polymorphobacter sp. PAMC 29334]
MATNGNGVGNLLPTSASFGHTLMTMLAGPSGKIGLIGILLLLAACLVTGVNGYFGRESLHCDLPSSTTVAATPSKQDRFQIIGVDPVQWQFSKRICVIVQNVVADSQLQKLRKAVVDSEAAISLAPFAQRAALRSDYVSAQSALTEFTKGFEYKLFVEGHPSTLTAHAVAQQAPQALSFTVKPDEDATSAAATFWRDILAQPTHEGRVPITIGLAPIDAAAPAASTATTLGTDGREHPITFLLYEPVVMWLALAGIVFVLIGLCGLSYETALLRDGVSNKNAYSLALVQMAFWLMLSTAGYIYVWLVTGEYLNVFPAALFVLIGISGATAGAAAVVDASKGSVAASRNFWNDIAGNWQGGQVQLHRLQIIAWTVILGLIFCWNVVANLRLVSFDTNLLLLAGVANGVYLTMKTQE